MKSVGFVGKTDKTELVQYIAKMLSSLGKKTIVVDATTIQKARYTVPVINGMNLQNQYIIEHDGIDIAIGFSNILELKKYLIAKGEDFTDYEYVLIDTDADEMCEEYDIKNANNIFFTTSFDKMHIVKGINLLKFICATKRKEDTEAKVSLTKILYYSDNINTVDARYIDNLSENLPLVWVGGPIILPYDAGDISVNIQNQYSSKIDFRYLSKDMKAGIVKIVSSISGEEEAKLKKVVKNIEKTARFTA